MREIGNLLSTDPHTTKTTLEDEIYFPQETML